MYNIHNRIIDCLCLSFTSFSYTHTRALYLSLSFLSFFFFSLFTQSKVNQYWSNDRQNGYGNIVDLEYGQEYCPVSLYYQRCYCVIGKFFIFIFFDISFSLSLTHAMVKYILFYNFIAQSSLTRKFLLKCH